MGKHPSIRSFSSASPRSGHGDGGFSRVTQTSLSPTASSNSSSGSEGSSGRRHGLTYKSYDDMPGTRPSTVGRRFDQMPEPPHPPLLTVAQQLLYSEPVPDDRASHLISKESPETCLRFPALFFWKPLSVKGCQPLVYTVNSLPPAKNETKKY